MEGKKEDIDITNCMFDEFYYNSDKQGKAELRRRSSILKQTRNLNLDICELEDTDFRRKSQIAKRVSFADTFQVKEYPTGNIYDIPGRHEQDSSKNSSSSQIGACPEVDKENIGPASKEPFVGNEYSFSSFRETSKEAYINHQDADIIDVGKENIGNLSRELLSGASSFIDHQELEVSQGNFAGRFALSFLESQKENLGIITNYSGSEVSDMKASSELMQHNTSYSETSKTFKYIQNVQNNLHFKCTPSADSFSCEPEPFLNKTKAAVNDMDITNLPSPHKIKTTMDDMDITHLPSPLKTKASVDDMHITHLPSLNKTKATVDDMDITCLPSPKAKSYADETYNKTKLTVNDMDMTCVAGHDFLDENSCDDVFLHNSIIASNDRDRNIQSVFENSDIVAPVPKKEYSLSHIVSALPFESIKIKSPSSSSYEKMSALPNFLADTNSSFLNEASEKYTKEVSSSLVEEKLSRAEINTKLDESSSNVPTGMYVSSIEKENVVFDKESHYSENSTHGVKFRKMFSNEEDTQDRIQVFNVKKSQYPLPSTNFLEDKENIELGRKRRSAETSSEWRNILNNKGTRHHLADVKALHFNSENEPKINETALNHKILYSKSMHETNKSLSSHNSKLFPVSVMDITCKSKCSVEGNADFINSFNNIPEDLKLGKSEYPLFNQKNLTEVLKTRHYESDGMELTSIGGCEDLHLIDDDSFEEKQIKCANLQSCSSSNNKQNDTNEVLNQTLISHEMQLTCTIKTSITSPFPRSKDASETQTYKDCSPGFKTLPSNRNNDPKVEVLSNINKPFFSNEMDKPSEKKCAIQSNTTHMTCNTESSSENSLIFQNSTNYNLAGENNAEFSLHNKLNLGEGIELTCVGNNGKFPSNNEVSFEAKAQKGSDNGFDRNLKFFDSSRTRHFSTDKMELTCAVKSSMELTKPLNDESHSSSHHKNLSAGLTTESGKYDDRTNPEIVLPDILHSSNVGKENILNSVDREKQYRDYHSVGISLGNCKSPGLGESNNLNLSIEDKYIDQTFDSHETESLIDRSHKLQLSSFFHLSSYPSIVSKEESAFNLPNEDNVFDKKFQIAQPNLSLSKKMGEENIPYNALYDKSLQTKGSTFKTESVSSEDNGHSWDIVLKPLNSIDPKLKMPQGLRNLSRTPGAVYTLRKKRQQITENFLKECLLSPEVKYILRKSEKFNLKQPFSEMKACSPINYNYKKSSSFHTFEIDGSFRAESKESTLPPSVQPFNSSLKTLNKNPGMISVAIPVPNRTIVEDEFTSGLKEKSQLPTIHSFNSSLKNMNENSGMASTTSLTPAPTSAFTSFVRQEANLSRQSHKVSSLEEKSMQNFSQVQQRSKNFSVNEDDSLQILSDSIIDTSNSLACKTLSEIFPNNLQERSLVKSESILIRSSKRDLLPSETFDLKENKIMKSSNDVSFSISQNDTELKDISKSGALNFKICSDQNAIQTRAISEDFARAQANWKCNDENTLMPKEGNVKKISLNSTVQKSQSFTDLNISKELVLKSTKNTCLPEKKNHDLPKTDDPVILNKTIIRDKISDQLNTVPSILKQSKCEPNLSVPLQQENVAIDLENLLTPTKSPEHLEIMPELLNETNLETVGSSKFAKLTVTKIPKYCEKNNPGKNILKNDGSKQSEDRNIQNIHVNYPAAEDHKLKSDGNELKTSSNEIPSKSNNFLMNPYNPTAGLIENSEYKFNKQKESCPPFSPGKMEINNAIWKTPNVSEPLKDTAMETNENDLSKVIGDLSTSGCCDSDALQDLDSLRNKFEEASKGSHWKLKFLNKEEAVFKLKWGVWYYKCKVMIHITCSNVEESRITLTPYPVEDPDDEYEPLGYKFFHFLAKDEIVPFSLFSDDLIAKLAGYSSIAEKVETLMRDIMHVSVDEMYDVSDNLDPLELHVEMMNEKHLSEFLITFRVNLRTYPYEKIIAEVKHLNYNDITKDVKNAIMSVEPGEDYMWNMIKLVNEL